MSFASKWLFRAYRNHATKTHKLNYLFWECTTRCNLNCLHCGSDCKKDARYADFPLEVFLKALDTIPNNRRDITVVLTGGEPLLRKDLSKAGREIRLRGMRWGMVSNGLLYTPEIHNELLSSGMGALTLSLDGMETNHNMLRGNHLSFSVTDCAIDLAASSPRLCFDVVSCVHPGNLEELDKVYDYLLNKGVKAWRLFTIAPAGRAAGNPDLLLNSGQLLQLMRFIEEKRRSSLMQVAFSCEAYVGGFETKVRDGCFFCRAGIQIGSVLIDGSIAACPNIDRTLVYGNVYHEDFYQVWQNRFENMRNRAWLKTGICSKCEEFDMCRGGGLHYRLSGHDGPLVCHFQMIRKALQ